MTLSTRIEAGQPSRELPKFARVGRLEQWLRDRRQRRMLHSYGGLQWCPWCKQCAQDANDKWRFDPHPPEMQYDALTCGVCGGTSLWLWGLGMHFIRPLDHPATALLAAVVRSTEGKNDV